MWNHEPQFSIDVSSKHSLQICSHHNYILIVSYIFIFIFIMLPVPYQWIIQYTQCYTDVLFIIIYHNPLNGYTGVSRKYTFSSSFKGKSSHKWMIVGSQWVSEWESKWVPVNKGNKFTIFWHYFLISCADQ